MALAATLARDRRDARRAHARERSFRTARPRVGARDASRETMGGRTRAQPPPPRARSRRRVDATARAVE